MRKVGSTTDTADSNGEYTNGNVANGISPTIINAEMLNTFQRELVNAVEGASITLDENDDAQLYKAIVKTIKQQSQALLNNVGYQKLPSGLIIQWGSGIADINGSKRINYPMPFQVVVYQVIVSPTNKYDNNSFVIANVDNTNYQLGYFDMVSYIFDMTSGVGRKDSNGFTWLAIGM
ncbi:gp53-like domain-containing protein [Klebsiella variicola]|uniref:gp53-like domain-containing protein n=1 Tax=Klebsiella variicola TaxID=244366 RepID=UPI003EB85AD5